MHDDLNKKYDTGLNFRTPNTLINPFQVKVYTPKTSEMEHEAKMG